MIARVLMVVVLLAVGLGLAGCGAQRTKLYLWPPAEDVNDP